jgi:hypothetical protein
VATVATIASEICGAPGRGAPSGFRELWPECLLVLATASVDVGPGSVRLLAWKDFGPVGSAIVGTAVDVPVRKVIIVGQRERD